MWTLFFGDVTDCTADVYARFEPDGSGPPPESVKESADSLILRGPVCKLSRTLPAKFSFEAVDERLWRTTVVDPCFWSQLLPARYQLFCTQRRSTLAELGIRRMGIRHSRIRGGDFFVDGRRSVIRAVRLPGDDHAVDPVDLTAEVAEIWRDNRMGVFIDVSAAWFDDLAQWATSFGVMVIAKVPNAESLDRMTKLRGWACVGMVCFDGTEALDAASLREVAPNQLLIADMRSAFLSGDVTTPEWAEMVLGPDDAHALERLRESAGGRGIMSMNSQDSTATEEMSSASWMRAPARWRRVCELHQGRLAPQLDLAGYVADSSASCAKSN